MTIDITPTETCGQHWVEVSMDNQPMRRHGPFSEAAEAEARACRIAAICRALKAEVHFAPARNR